MKKASKNIGIGEVITDIRDLKRLADEGKSVIQQVGYANRNYIVRPAMFYLQWPLVMLLNQTFYYSIKLK